MLAWWCGGGGGSGRGCGCGDGLGGDVGCRRGGGCVRIGSRCGGSECDGVSVADIVVVGGDVVVIAGVMLWVGGFFRVVVVIWA